MAHSENCRNLLASLSDYVDGELKDELCAEIEKHMQGCENCRIVVDTLRKTVLLVHENSHQTQLPGDVRQRLFHHLDLDEFLD
jgi:anti-sigma factor (TIGR02949 family)